MKPEEINVAIAEACGWEFVPSHDRQGKAVPERWMKDGFEYFDDRPFPNYCGDLNAIHIAEETLSEDQGGAFEIWLEQICQNQLVKDGSNHWLRFKTAHATAPQRCEAFLRTISKWVETKGEGE